MLYRREVYECTIDIEIWVVNKLWVLGCKIKTVVFASIHGDDSERVLGYLEEELIIDRTIDYSKQVGLSIIHIQLVDIVEPFNISIICNLNSNQASILVVEVVVLPTKIL